MYLTKSDSLIIGNVAKVLGLIMDAIFRFLDSVTGGHANTGVAIIIMTFIIYMLMLPLTYRQQKFSKLQTKMMPEIKKIQAKYKNRKDQQSMMMMNEETKEVYAKYGVSPSGSCVQLVIQMPILFALYRVIYNIPAYVTQVHGVFDGLIDGLVNKIGIAQSSGIMETLSSYRQFAKQFESADFAENVGNYAGNTFIDVLNRATSADWELLKSNSLIVQNGLVDAAQKTHDSLNAFNNFLGLNIGDSPWFSLRNSGGSVIVIIMAILIPILAALTQYINFQLMPQASSAPTGNDTADSMAASMKTMNTTMPLLSAVMCFTLPAGLGLYWIAGAVIRSIQQIFVNRHIDKIDFDEIIAQNMEKAKQKAGKQARKEHGMSDVSEKKFHEYSSMSTKNAGRKNTASVDAERDRRIEENSKKKYKAGSLAEKANMVNRYNNHSK